MKRIVVDVPEMYGDHHVVRVREALLNAPRRGRCHRKRRAPKGGGSLRRGSHHARSSPRRDHRRRVLVGGSGSSRDPAAAQRRLELVRRCRASHQDRTHRPGDGRRFPALLEREKQECLIQGAPTLLSAKCSAHAQALSKRCSIGRRPHWRVRSALMVCAARTAPWAPVG